MIQFESLSFFALIPVMFIFLMLLVFHKFTEGPNRKRLRMIIFFIRLIMFTGIIILLAAPFISDVRTEMSETTVNFLIDRSNSMELYQDDSQKLVETLEELGVNVIEFGDEYRSPVGNVVLSNLLGEDNILLMSDGNANYGRDLESVLLLASSLNSTVNALDMNQLKDDASITILGPKVVLRDLSSTFFVQVQSSSEEEYTVTLLLDGIEFRTFKAKGDHTEPLDLSFASGYHNLEARLALFDERSENNKFLKVINSLDKPKVLYVTKSSSPVEDVISNIYDMDKRSTIPQDLRPYFAVILNDLPSSEIDARFTELTDFVLDGNGVYVIGGRNSFDLGGYDSSQAQTLLPVRIGSPVIEDITDLNIVLLIDISVSSGLETGGGTVVNIEKSQAISIFNQLTDEDYIGVIAFNNDGHIISPLRKWKDQFDTPQKISQLQNSGGTYLENGLTEAKKMLEQAEGNKNIIVISDGKTKNPATVLSMARDLRSQGTTIYTVGVGEATDTGYMGELATAGGGIYYQSTAHEQVTLNFDNERDEVKDSWSLAITSSNHFATNGVALNAKVSGFNQVVPKPSAEMLVATPQGYPILTTWRFGLGRVAALTTNPSYWSSDLMAEGNAKIFSRSANWVVGDPRRNEDLIVNIRDGRQFEEAEIRINSEKVPEIEDVQLNEVDTNIYSGRFIPEDTGFFEILGERFAINYPSELESVQLNPQLDQLIKVTGGEVLDINDLQSIVEKIRKDSERRIEDRFYFRYYIIPVLLLLYIIEIYLRKKALNKITEEE